MKTSIGKRAEAERLIKEGVSSSAICRMLGLTPDMLRTIKIQGAK